MKHLLACCRLIRFSFLQLSMTNSVKPIDSERNPSPCSKAFITHETDTLFTNLFPKTTPQACSKIYLKCNFEGKGHPPPQYIRPHDRVLSQKLEDEGTGPFRQTGFRLTLAMEVPLAPSHLIEGLPMHPVLTVSFTKNLVFFFSPPLLLVEFFLQICKSFRASENGPLAKSHRRTKPLLRPV